MTRPVLTRVHWALIALVALGATFVALIGLAGSYLAVRRLAFGVGMGRFAYAFPIGVDVGILVLLALDLLLTWLRIPFPLLRPTAWGLTAATIAFNAASSWPDPLGTGMHAVIPVLFIIISEATRHAISRIARLSSDRTIDKIRLTRWLLAPRQTWAMWRRMQLWEIRSLDEAVRLEQARLAYLTLLEDAPLGPDGKLPAAAHLPLKLNRLGVPIEWTYEDGLAAAGVATRPLDRLFAARASIAAGRPQQTEAPADSAQQVPTIAGPRKELASADGEIPSTPVGGWTEPLRAQFDGVAGPASGRPAALREPAGQSSAVAGPGPEAFAGVGHLVRQSPAPPQADPESSQASDSRTALAGSGQPEEPLQETFAVLAETTRTEGSERAVDPGENDLPTIDPAVAEKALAAGIPMAWTVGFAVLVAEYGRHPGPEELRRHLYKSPYNLRARGKDDQPVSLRSVERYYNDLKDLFPLPGQEDQERFQLESAGA